MGDYNGALFDFDLAIEKNNTDPSNFNARGNIKVYFGQYQEAIADFTTAVNLNRNFAEAYYNRGLTYIFINQTNKGCNDLKQSEILGLTKAIDKINHFCKTN